MVFPSICITFAPQEEYHHMTKYQILSGSSLKVLAMVTMLIDHLAAFYFYDDPWFRHALFDVGHKHVSVYFLMRAVGRIAFPIFAFLLVEGFQHTSNRKRYGLSLLLFALLSEIPWNLVHCGSLLYRSQNVLFTLLLGFLGMWAIERYRDESHRMAAALIGLLVASVLLRADYGCSGFGFIIMLYALRQHRLWQAVVGSCMLGGRWLAGLAFIPINMYNGKRGFITGPLAKYLFYVFYPLHLLIIYLLR